MSETIDLSSTETEIPSWNRPRTTEQLLSFIAMREAKLELGEGIDL